MKSIGRLKNRALYLIGVFILFISWKGAAQPVFDTCDVWGNAVRANAKTLNVKKNRWDVPSNSQINRTITFKKLLDSDSLPKGFVEGDAAEIVGYVSDVKLGAIETCNCKKSDSAHRDTHIELTLEPNVNIDKTKLLVVEVTPRYQRTKIADGLDWSTRGLRNAFLGRWVRIRGWVFFDKMHADESAGSDNERVWRGTAWEIHPVTDITLSTQDAALGTPTTDTARAGRVTPTTVTAPPTSETPVTDVDKAKTERPLRQCSAITAKGARCRRMTSNVSGRCWQHER